MINLKRLFTDEEAVSPVIGVILMVAITVILAAVIGAFVLDLGGKTSATPQANFEGDYDNSLGELTLTHTSGDAIEAANLGVVGDVNETDSLDSHSAAVYSDQEFTSGDRVTVKATEGQTARITFESEDGSNSATLLTHEVTGTPIANFKAEDNGDGTATVTIVSAVPIDNIEVGTDASLTESPSNSGSAPYEYTLTYDPMSDGDYTLSLDTAEIDESHAGWTSENYGYASGQETTVSVSGN